MAKEHFIHTAEAIPTVEETLLGYFMSPRCEPTKTEGTALRKHLWRKIKDLNRITAVTTPFFHICST